MIRRSRAAPATRGRSRRSCAPTRSRWRTGCRWPLSLVGVRRRGSADAEGDLHPGRADVPRPDPAVGGGHPDHRAGVRQLDRRWRVRAGHVRSRGDDQGTLQGFPGRAAAGQDGHRRGVRRRVAGRGRDAARTSGLGDYLANDELDAIRIGRRIVAQAELAQEGPVPAPVVEPKFDPEELIGIVPADLRIRSTRAM